MLRKIGWAVAALMAISALAGGPVWAHAHVKASVPAKDAVVAASPTEIVLDLAEPIEPSLSWVHVTDAAGTRLDGALGVDASRATRLHLALSAPCRGTCQVTWRLVSVDTHVTQGGYHFTVQ